MRTLCFLLFVSSPILADEPLPTVTARANDKVVKVIEQAAKHPQTGLDEIVKVTIFGPREFDKPINLKHSAIIICDMWDKHWCDAATTRCDKLAKDAAPIIAAARKAGATIIHCPSDCMAFYKEHPARVRTLALKKVEPPKSKDIPSPPLPIDDTDGGCDDAAPVKPFKAWKCQHEAIEIDGKLDFISDKGDEVYNALQERGVKTVFVMGVHTNMCVLNRSFAIKQLRKWDIDCLLVRDLTDAMYNPKMKPLTTHENGTQLVIEYIETHWCPSVESKDLTKIAK